MSTVSTKPYLIRAIWEWCVDQGYTPYLATLVDAQTRVPPGYAKDGQIVLNVGPDATHQLQMENDFISFQARFNGTPHSLVIPISNVIAIYARENGEGMAFEPESGVDAQPETADEADLEAVAEADGEGPGTPGEPPGRPRGGHLKVVK
ncbi:ClpXP protease specificity-enhancing factor [Thauera sinica]|uniref:ClpXP protease specificity-enhancing factor n=1 Tax=Thauera sinica TaxID=2665146 RepID=A0ABW1ASQ0_9RHOO|nr:ClpXP protease specificity-enhancing factor [Thauera sp. K11]ATE58962.1 ClpXP protease specificity-enhancing factor [Thauera sp. K11]